jgi:hypothetical protein
LVTQNTCFGVFKIDKICLKCRFFPNLRELKTQVLSDLIKKLQSTDSPKSGHSLSDTNFVCLFRPSFGMVWQCSHPSFAPHSAGPRSIFLKIRIPTVPGVWDLPQLSNPEWEAGRVSQPIVEVCYVTKVASCHPDAGKPQKTERLFAVTHVTANNTSVTANNLSVFLHFWGLGDSEMFYGYSGIVNSYSEMLIRSHISFPTDRPIGVWYRGGRRPLVRL